MKLTKQQIGISIVALVMFGIIIGIVVYILSREIKETLTRLNPTNAIESKGINMNIEHKSGYNQSVRGYRNNNPLNLRISSHKWKGKVPASQNTDGAFEQFETMAYGFRAALKNLQTYINKCGCSTIATIVNKWAPASDGNNPTNYANTVASRTGISKTEGISASDKEQMCQIAAAMAYVENGSAPLMEDVYAGWNMI